MPPLQLIFTASFACCVLGLGTKWDDGILKAKLKLNLKKSNLSDAIQFSSVLFFFFVLKSQILGISLNLSDERPVQCFSMQE